MSTISELANQNNELAAKIGRERSYGAALCLGAYITTSVAAILLLLGLTTAGIALVLSAFALMTIALATLRSVDSMCTEYEQREQTIENLANFLEAMAGQDVGIVGGWICEN